jgi:hypothetical protein
MAAIRPHNPNGNLNIPLFTTGADPVQTGIVESLSPADWQHHPA